jgi:DNA polymerase III alpha subunit
MLDAYGTVQQITEHCKKIGYKTVALTDHGSVS